MLDMSTFRKAVLSVGTYHSPDGTVVCTPERLQHWKNEVAKIQAAGYAIPMHWDHAGNEDMDLLEPVKLSTLREGIERSARNTVGKLVSFDVAPDGQSAELTVQTLTPQATQLAESNAVYVSPVLFDYWKDGAGNVYTDTIGSIDLVDYPVDHSQGPFVPVAASRMSCAIRMSAAPRKLFRLSEQMPMDNETEPDTDDGAAPYQAPAPQAPPSSTRVSDAIQGLAALKIMLPEDTTPENFLDRLVPALMTAAAQVAPVESTEQLPPEPEEAPEEKPVLGETPQVAAMSTRLRNFEAKLIEGARKDLSKRLQNLLETGRAIPAEIDEKSKRLGVQKLSLAKDDTVNGGDLAVWIEARESTPEGSCWDAVTRTKKLGLVAPKPRKEWNTVTPDVEEARKQKREMLRQKI